jgi:hypothetical protein
LDLKKKCERVPCLNGLCKCRWKILKCRSAQARRLKSSSIVRSSRGACSSAPPSVFTFMMS